MPRSPAPEPGSVRVHSDVSPVLAQAFTEPFTVYSAKRFPGVPGEINPVHLNFLISHELLTEQPSTHINVDTTALSIAFGNQGQKLPLVSFSSFICYPFSSPFPPFPLSASADQVPSTSYMTIEKSTWHNQEPEKSSQRLRWWLRRRFRLMMTRGQKGRIRLFCGVTRGSLCLVNR